MFLLAKLVCENLYEQSNLEDLDAELDPHSFPREINEAYGLPLHVSHSVVLTCHVGTIVS